MMNAQLRPQALYLGQATLAKRFKSKKAKNNNIPVLKKPLNSQELPQKKDPIIVAAEIQARATEKAGTIQAAGNAVQAAGVILAACIALIGVMRTIEYQKQANQEQAKKPEIDKREITALTVPKAKYDELDATLIETKNALNLAIASLQRASDENANLKKQLANTSWRLWPRAPTGTEARQVSTPPPELR
ncbi:MAG: hypothetical protein K0Q57_686 [Gammaproteobacteria bacterium]|nr:hypothetical protein [Gammaproteobacteria bacterium]